jgi:hypothetical protein
MTFAAFCYPPVPARNVSGHFRPPALAILGGELANFADAS